MLRTRILCRGICDLCLGPGKIGSRSQQSAYIYTKYPLHIETSWIDRQTDQP